MRTIYLQVDDELYKETKINAIKTELTLKNYITQCLKQYNRGNKK